MKTEVIMKNVVYFHGIHGDTQKSIAPYLETEFKNLGITMYYPQFFNTETCSYEAFEKIANQLLNDGVINNETIVISHSIGNSFSIRFLFEHNLKPFAYISLAGYCDKFPLNNEDIKNKIYNALPTKEQLRYLAENVEKRISLYSNDHLIPEDLLKNFSKQIYSTLYYLENKGHFGIRMEIQELPELIEILKENQII